MARGYLDFVSGTAPNEAAWDDYIGKQVVGVYDDDLDRDTQIGDEVVEGMRAYSADTGIEHVAMLDPLAVPPTVAADFTWLEFGRTKAWTTTHVPTLTATGTSPTIGTGPTLLCRWTLEGTLATVAYYVAFGTSGSAAGTGTYELDLPPECPAAAAWYGAQEFVAGNGISVDSSAGTRKAVAVSIVGASTIRLEADGLTGAVTESNLIAWADSDVVLSAVITYETAEVY